MIHDSTEVRAATLRTLRHLTKTKNDLKQLNDLHVPYLVTRCLDLELENKVERLQALKLARNLAYISLSSEEDVFPLILLRSIGKLISRNFSKYHTAQCGNIRIGLSSRFYVKSILRILEVQNRPLYHI